MTLSPRGRRRKEKRQSRRYYGELDKEKEQRCTHHNGDEMPIVVRKRSVTPQNEMLGTEEVLQVRRMRGHHP